MTPAPALVLGTAQWGHAYGVTNTAGRLSDEAVRDIVAVAREWGIHQVDTARGYGDAEERLRPYARDFAVTTKVAGGADVKAQVESAVATLGVESLHAVLVHDWDAIDCKGQGLSVLAFGELLDRGVIERAGVSVYDLSGLESAVAAFDAAGVPLGALQVPANVLDRRLDASSLLTELSEGGTEVVVRSAFLQGLLLSTGGGLADHRDVVRFRSAVGDDGSMMEMCLSHVKALPWASHVVVGVTSGAQLREIARVWAACPPVLAPENLGSVDLDLIDPRRWK